MELDAATAGAVVATLLLLAVAYRLLFGRGALTTAAAAAPPQTSCPPLPAAITKLLQKDGDAVEQLYEFSAADGVFAYRQRAAASKRTAKAQLRLPTVRVRLRGAEVSLHTFACPAVVVDAAASCVTVGGVAVRLPGRGTALGGGGAAALTQAQAEETWRFGAAVLAALKRGALPTDVQSLEDARGATTTDAKWRALEGWLADSLVSAFEGKEPAEFVPAAVE